MSDFTIHLSDNTITSHSHPIEPWKVTLIDTGLSTETGGRVKRYKVTSMTNLLPHIWRWIKQCMF